MTRQHTHETAWKELEPAVKEIARLIMTCPMEDNERMLLSLKALAGLIGTSAGCMRAAGIDAPIQDVMSSIFDAVTPALIKADGGMVQ